jgi:hypothetical protein
MKTDDPMKEENKDSGQYIRVGTTSITSAASAHS